MRVRFLSSVAGVHWSYDAGEEADLPDEEARAFVHAGTAEPVTPAPESAALARPPETTTQPPAKPRKGGK
jgi:hypothetical protein